MILIPARLKSTRFPQKMLANLGGLPLIVRTAKNAARFDDVVVACDDWEVLGICERHGVRAILTSEHHASGTDRCAEACRTLGVSSGEMILNVQGDEPFLEEELIRTLQNITRESPFMASLAKKIAKEDAKDPNLVKVVLDSQKRAVVFSRSPIPYDRDGGDEVEYLGHLGVYGFFGWSLQEFCALQKSAWEDIEKLEQLRAIYHQKPIMMEIVETDSIGIDTQEDLQKAQKILEEMQA